MSRQRLSVWPPMPFGVYARGPAGGRPFPLDHPSCRLFSRGRHALWHGLQGLGLEAGDELLAPAYHHGSEIEVLSRLGIRCRFYDCSHGSLEPDEDQLDALIGPAVRGLYLIHYLGFPQDAARWRTWCDDRGLLLIEDAAQAWLARANGRPVGSLGDIAIFCLYKTFGLPDGAALLSSSPSPSPAGGRLALFDLAKRHGARIAQLYGLPFPLLDRAAGTDYVPGLDFALGDPATPPARATEFLLPRVADAGAAARRRANLDLLLDELGDRAARPFLRREDEASPFAFPIALDDKAPALARLLDAGVDALDLWSAPHPSLPDQGFSNAASWRSRIVALPVHQELRLVDVERIAAAARPGRATCRQVRLEPIPGFEAGREDWQRLAEQSGNVFATWEWASTWWRHFGDGRPLLLTTCRGQSHEPLAILPMYVSASRPLRTVRFVGHGPADQLGPVCRPADRALAARALRRALDSEPCDVFLGDALPAEEGWATLLGGRTLRRAASPLLRIDGLSWEGFLAGRSANFRQQVRRRERNLARRHELRYRLAQDPDRVPDDIERLFRLHEARWGRSGEAFAGRRKAFHREFAQLAFERGWLRLWFLELDGEPVAAWYGLRFGGADWYYQAGRDPAWEQESVGVVLLAHTIRESIGDGMREYRLLRGGEAYKAGFASHDLGLETVALARGVPARALSAAAARTGPLPRQARRLAAKLAG